jgi:ATP-dependent helicase/nuclease subunit B
MPSRLLFSCPDDELLARTELLFREPSPSSALPPPSPGVTFRPDQVPQRGITRLSVSQINAYLFCPTRFYFQVILGMQTCDDRSMEPDAATFGTLMHQVLEQVVKAGPCSERAWEERCKEALRSVLTHHVGEPDNMSLRVLQHSAFKRLIAVGRVQRGLWEEGWMPIEYETRFSRICNGVEVVGKVDRIDRHPERGLRILDYKTSDSPDKPAAAHLGLPREGRERIQVEVDGKHRQWKNLQLPLYRWLTAPTYPDESIEVAYINLPSAVTETQLVTWDQEPTLSIEAETCLKNVIDLIREGVWHPTTTTSNPRDAYQPLLMDGSAWVPGAS